MSFIFFKNNRRNSHKKKLRTFEARGDENVKNIEFQQKNLVLIKKLYRYKAQTIGKQLEEIYQELVAEN